jgi:hypothetical protein
MPRIIFTVSDAERELWVEAAHSERISLSEWLRRAARSRVGIEAPSEAIVTPAGDPPPGPSVPSGSARPRNLKRTGLCPHRVPAGQFCKRCDTGA